MSDKIHDLDVLRPKKDLVRLGGKEIDVGFIPSGVALEVMSLEKELRSLMDSPEKLKKIQKGGKEAKRSFEIAAELCAVITSKQHPEMDKKWLLNNTDVIQIKALMDHILASVQRSVDNVEDADTKKL